jgi:hypothetical protein
VKPPRGKPQGILAKESKKALNSGSKKILTGYLVYSIQKLLGPDVCKI